MALPKSNAPTQQYYRSGIHLEAMLDLEDCTRDLLPSIATHNEHFASLLAQDDKLQALSIKAYARLLWADNHLDNLVRDLSADLKKIDRHQPTLRAHERFFPEGGFAGVIQPSGRAVSSEIDTLRKRFPVLDDLSSQAPELAAHLQSLEAACKTAEAALAAVTRLDQQRAQLSVEADILRNAWRTAAYQIEGELNRRFPGRKDIVRDFFYSPSSESSTATASDAPTPPSPNQPS